MSVQQATRSEYSEFPPGYMQVASWHEIAIDLTGPWNFNVYAHKYKLHALTIIDTITTYC